MQLANSQQATDRNGGTQVSRGEKAGDNSLSMDVKDEVVDVAGMGDVTNKKEEGWNVVTSRKSTS